MKNNEKAFSWLKSKGFELIKEENSIFFGDYYRVFTNGSIQIMFRGCRSFEMVDVRSNLPDEDWYDLALVKSLMFNEQNLNSVTVIEELIDFLQKELANIVKLFHDRNYQTTKNRLEELENKRAEQRFPEMRRKKKLFSN